MRAARVSRRKELTGEKGKRRCKVSLFLPAESLISYQEKMRGRRCCWREREQCSPLAFYSPKTGDWEAWLEEKGVMVKRSDGERKGTEKNRKWPREGYKRGREVHETAKKEDKEWGWEEKEDKRCWLNDRRSCWQLYHADIKGKVHTFFKSVLKQYPHADMNTDTVFGRC